MKSRIYDCEVTHARTTPRKHQFQYRYFTFCLDLDEINLLGKKSFLFGKGAAKIFRFQAKDFIFSEGKNGNTDTDVLKTAVIEYAGKHGVTEPIARVEIVAHMRTLGYSFNPAAFYFCYSKSDQPICAILEVTNTYREKKAYFLGTHTFNNGAFRSQQSKLFYVSPFVDLPAVFDMVLAPPGEFIELQINSILSGVLQVHSMVRGKASALTDLGLAKRFFLQPLITIGVMAKIHYQAFRLYLKNIPYVKKEV